jgi:K+-transporting ATPase ATPase C chain
MSKGSHMRTESPVSLLQLMRPALVSLLLFTIITGVLYPLLVTGIAQAVFPQQANGSLIAHAAGGPAGSQLVGQQFDGPHYFWGRLSATGGVPYNGAASSASNLGPLNPALIGSQGSVQVRIAALAAANAAAGVTGESLVPVDLVTASGSGLDPHISPAAAHYQAGRVAAARGISLAEVKALIAEFTEERTFGLLGEPRVNVLLLNLALDERS